LYFVCLDVQPQAQALLTMLMQKVSNHSFQRQWSENFMQALQMLSSGPSGGALSLVSFMSTEFFYMHCECKTLQVHFISNIFQYSKFSCIYYN